ncbi:hypothetical protein EDD15DRAFT_1383470 [Pisolithus albus]|nr:hypothetical protein EDD15DRAFT_1383470 [Pisolithus albus]
MTEGNARQMYSSCLTPKTTHVVTNVYLSSAKVFNKTRHLGRQLRHLSFGSTATLKRTRSKCRGASCRVGFMNQATLFGAAIKSTGCAILRTPSVCFEKRPDIKTDKILLAIYLYLSSGRAVQQAYTQKLGDGSMQIIDVASSTLVSTYSRLN